MAYFATPPLPNVRVKININIDPDLAIIGGQDPQHCYFDIFFRNVSCFQDIYKIMNCSYLEENKYE